MYIELGNFYYFFYIIITGLLTLGSILFLKNKTNTFRYWFLFGLLVFGFLIHFLKVFIYPYNSLPSNRLWSKISLENVCAISTVFFPFIYLSKNKTLKDYMVMGGIVSGLVSIFFPLDAISSSFDGMADYWRKPAFSLEIFRFYFAHINIFLVPFLMIYFKMHDLSLKRAPRAPFVFLGVLVIIFLNELLVTAFGWVPKEDLFQPDKRNPSLIFGVKPELASQAVILMIFVPTIFTINPVTGASFYWPVVWMAIPVLIYSSLLVLVFMWIFRYEETKHFFMKLFRMNSQTAENEI